VKTKYLLLSVVFAAFLSSSMPQGSHSLEIGSEAPAIELSSDAVIKNLDMLNGKYVLVNFWSAADARSRINNKRLADLSASLPADKIAFVSICTDTDTTIADEILKADNVPADIIYLSAADTTPQVTEDFQTETGLRSFLIDPFGNLSAVSPSNETINSKIFN